MTFGAMSSAPLPTASTHCCADAVHEVRLRGLPALCRSDRRRQAQINQCPPVARRASPAWPAAAATGAAAECGARHRAAAARRGHRRGPVHRLHAVHPGLPVDAIVGAPKMMHTVLAAACTGCDLCLPPCPMDCIAMVRSSRRATGRRPMRRGAGPLRSPHLAAAARDAMP